MDLSSPRSRLDGADVMPDCIKPWTVKESQACLRDGVSTAALAEGARHVSDNTCQVHPAAHGDAHNDLLPAACDRRRLCSAWACPM